MYRLENVSLKFKNKTILNNFSYSFKEKGLYYIIGPTGCGKTTLLKLMYLNKYKYTGNVYFNNQNIKGFSYKKIELIRNDITYIGVKNQAFNSLTLRQNLKIILGKEYDNNKIDEFINKYDLTKYLDKKYKNLSMGEKERFLLIIPLIKRTRIVMIDEGFANLDRKYSLMLKEEYENLAKESLVIIVEHILENIEKGEIIDFNKLENNYVTEDYSYAERKVNKKLGFINYLRIFKMKIMINLLLVGALIILSSIFISSLYTTKIDEDELEAMCLRALPTDTILIDETRINPSDYNITNKILYFDNYNLPHYDMDQILGTTFVCDELNMNGKKVHLKDGFIYIGKNRNYKFNDYQNGGLLKAIKFNNNSDILKEERVLKFTSEKNPDVDLDEYVGYFNIVYMNYNTFRMTYEFQRVIIENKDGFSACIASEDIYYQENIYESSHDFNKYDILVHKKDEVSNKKMDFSFSLIEPEIKVIIPNLASDHIGAVCVSTETGYFAPYYYLKNELFKKYFYDEHLTYGDTLLNKYKKIAYQLSADSDIKGLVRENKKRIANGEEEIFKILANSNLEYKKEMTLLVFEANSYLEKIGLSGVIIFLLLILINSKSKENKILLIYNYKANDLFFSHTLLNMTLAILVYALSYTGGKLFFNSYFAVNYLAMENYSLVLYLSIAISILFLVFKEIADYFVIKKGGE